MTIESINPATGAVLESYEEMTPVAAQDVVAQAHPVFGLGGSVLTRDIARGERIAAELIESGCVFVNEAVRSVKTVLVA